MARRSAVPQSQVPFLHEKQIEAEANALLAEFGEEFGALTAPPVPIDEIAESLLGLTLEYKDMKSMFPMADVHGAIWFEQRTIGIDQDLDPDANPSRRGRYHFTLAHEVGHWRLHRQHYIKNPAERLLFGDGSPKPDVVCRSSERKKPVEWQADSFAACLLMPRRMVHIRWADWRGGCDEPASIGEVRAQFKDAPPRFRNGSPITEPESFDLAMKEEFCRPLAEAFAVSTEAMRIRLEQLELLVTVKNRTLF